MDVEKNQYQAVGLSLIDSISWSNKSGNEAWLSSRLLSQKKTNVINRYDVVTVYEVLYTQLKWLLLLSPGQLCCVFVDSAFVFNFFLKVCVQTGRPGIQSNQWRMLLKRCSWLTSGWASLRLESTDALYDLFINLWINVGKRYVNIRPNAKVWISLLKKYFKQ